jgi:hypothetical protein
MPDMRVVCAIVAGVFFVVAVVLAWSRAHL